MSLVGDLRAALKTNLDTIPGINVSRYILFEPTPPVVHLWPDGIEYDRAMGKGAVVFTFRVQAVAALSTDIAPQQTLDALMDPTGSHSVKTAAESDTTLGGLCDDVFCSPASGYAVSTSADGRPRLTVDWTVQVWVNASE